MYGSEAASSLWLNLLIYGNDLGPEVVVFYRFVTDMCGYGNIFL